MMYRKNLIINDVTTSNNAMYHNVIHHQDKSYKFLIGQGLHNFK